MAMCAILSLPARAQAGSALDNAQRLMSEHHFGDAETIVREFVQRNPQSGEGHFFLGYILFSESKPVESLAEYTTGAKYKKPELNDLMAIGADYVLLNDNEDAARLFRHATEAQPRNEQAWYYLGRALFYQAHYDDAVKAFEVCLQLTPQNVQAETNLGLTLQEMGRHAEAVAAYQRAIAWSEEGHAPSGQAYLDLGLLLQRQVSPNDSLKYLQRAAVLEPNNPETQYELGKAYAETKRYEDAEAFLQKATSLDPDAPSVHYILGRVYKAEGKTAQASTEFAIVARLSGEKSARPVHNFDVQPNSPAR